MSNLQQFLSCVNYEKFFKRITSVRHIYCRVEAALCDQSWT